ncbi:MAG: head GIN domain-containing protein [Bacteroidota bacterium]
MKRTPVFLWGVMMSLLLLSACIGPFAPTPTNPNVIVSPLSNFDEISVDVPLQLELTQDPSFDVELSGDSLWLSRIDIDVVNNVLEVRFAPDTSGFTPPDSLPLYDVKLAVSLPSLVALELKTATKTSTTSLFTIDDLQVNLDGAAEADLELDGDSLYVDVDGAGDITLEADLLTLDLSVAGAARYEGEGTVDNQLIVVKGAGNVEAFDMVSQHCEIDFLGAGEAEVNAQQSLDVQIVGAATVYYKGNPSITQSISGLGSLVDSN